jgi:predicted nucleic acid-binding protein
MKSTKIFDTSTIVCIFQEAKFPKIIDNCLKKDYKLIIPTQVYDELKVNINTFSYFKQYADDFTIRDTCDEYFEYLSRRYPRLHKGEIGVLSLGIEFSKLNNLYICFLDEGPARIIGEQLHLRTAGLVGLSLWERKNGDISKPECKLIYDNISKSPFRIKKEILEKLIE